MENRKYIVRVYEKKGNKETELRGAVAKTVVCNALLGKANAKTKRGSK